MSLGDDPHATTGGVGEDLSHNLLGTRMKVKLGLFDIDKLSIPSSLKGNNNGQCLRNSNTNVGDIYKILDISCIR